MKPSILQVAITKHNAWLHKVLSFLLNLCNLIPFGGSSVEKKKTLEPPGGFQHGTPVLGKKALLS